MMRCDAEQLAVAVESGSVEGGLQRPLVAQGATALDVSPVNVATATVWRQGKAVFDATPLEVIVTELNRYRAQPILLRSASLRQLRVAGEIVPR